MRRWAAGLLACSLLLGGCAVAPITPTDAPVVQPDRPVVETPAAGGEQTQQQPTQGAPETKPKRAHVDVHGLYMTGWTAGSDRFYELVDYMKQTGLNAVVIDVQDDDGQISWQTEIPLAKEIGANEDKITDIDKRIQYLKEKGIYTIGRIVVYADPLLGRKRPDMAILKGEFVDTRGIRWPDPYNPKVWEYKVAIAKEAARRGFDEIQFDYIRFPEHRIEGYNYHVPVQQRTGAILGFLRYARQELEPMGVFMATDVFGLTTSVAEGDDMEIGQDYAAMANVVDYILPMVYPSHYAPGTYGIGDPNSQPGEIVYQSLVAAQKRTWGIDVKKHRPWIQDFNLGKTYTAADVEDQILGLARAGIYQWILWDPNNRYTKGVNYNIAGFSGPPGAWRADYEQERTQHAQEVMDRAIRSGRTVN
jgi:hypothetical protein